MNPSLLELKGRLLYFSQCIHYMAQSTLETKVCEVLQAFYLKANLKGLASVLRYYAGDITKLGSHQAHSYWRWIDAVYFYLEATSNRDISSHADVQKLIFVVEELSLLEQAVNAQPDLFGVVYVEEGAQC